MTVTTRGAARPGSTPDERVDTGSLDAAVLTVASNVDRWASTPARRSRRRCSPGWSRTSPPPRPRGTRRPARRRASTPTGTRAARSCSPASACSRGSPSSCALAPRDRPATDGRGSPARCATCRAGAWRWASCPGAGWDRVLLPASAARSGCSPASTSRTSSRPGACLPGPRGRTAASSMRARRGQRRVARAERRASKLFVEREGRRAQGEPGQRLPRRALGARPASRSSTRACCASFAGGGAAGAHLVSALARRRGPRHRVRQDLRRDRVRPRRGGRAAQGGRRPPRDQAGHRRARERVACHRRPRDGGPRRTCPTRPTTWRRCSSTTRASTASRRACS